MGLTHKLRPQVVVSDQGSQFVSFHFRDFLSDEQVKFWPATVYTPQQNAVIERVWGTRFGMARALLKFANLGPAMHPYALQCANWICNRLPQSSRANMSPVYILSRRPASIGYLKSIGCLVRVTIPLARRDGDRHFADRGMLGIYLGPSEQSPGCIVYVPAVKKFYVTRDVICYEDVHPGVKHIEAKWSELPEGLEGTPLVVPQPVNTVQSDTLVPQSLPLPETRESIQQLSAPDHDVQDTGGPSEVTSEGLGSASPLTAHEDVQVEVSGGPSADSDPTQDPSSRQFKRVLPPRSTRYQGAYECGYVDPASATVDQAISNVAHLNGAMLATRSDLIVYESCVGGLTRAYVVTVTNELGQVQIPKGFQHSLRTPEAAYWREAILKEYKGLLAIGTFEFIRLSDVPPSANIMRCHLVFDLKRNGDGSIDKFKARLVADGNTQRYGVDFDRMFSTVAKLSTLRIVFAIAAARDLNLSSIDIRQAYLQATLNEELYMHVPPGMPDADADGNKLVARLRRSLYGLKQAGREWHVLLTHTLKSWGFTQSAIDVCLFTYSRGSSTLIIVVWVDDCVIADNDPALRQEFVDWLGEKFPVEDKGELRYNGFYILFECRGIETRKPCLYLRSSTSVTS